MGEALKAIVRAKRKWSYRDLWGANAYKATYS